MVCGRLLLRPLFVVLSHSGSDGVFWKDLQRANRVHPGRDGTQQERMEPMRLRMFGATDRGLVRKTNQDAYSCSAELGLAVVSDGMGGHKGGEKASQLTTDGLVEAFEARSELKMEDVSTHLDQALRRINRRIHEMSRDNENLRGMGATVNYVHFSGGHIAIGHAGDSRTYLVKAWQKPDGKTRYGMWQLTIDHNVETFLERGLLVPGVDVPHGPLSERHKSRLTRGMGVMPDLKADLYYRKVEENDVYLTCSDGLHGFVTDEEILKAVVQGPIEKSPERLIALALKAGAPDNVTVVVSVVSEQSEPMKNVKKPIFETAPFLVRDQSGQISRVMSADDLIKKWMAFEIPNEAEICSARGKWIQLEKRKVLLKSYPELDRAQVRERLDHIAPQSVVSSDFPTSQDSSPPHANRKSRSLRKEPQTRIRRTTAISEGQSASAVRLLILAGILAGAGIVGYTLWHWYVLAQLPVY